MREGRGGEGKGEGEKERMVGHIRKDGKRNLG